MKCCKIIDELVERVIAKQKENNNKKPILTTIVLSIIFIIGFILFNIVIKPIILNISNECLKKIIYVYLSVLTITGAISTILLLAFTFDNLTVNCVSKLKCVLKCAVCILYICVSPVVLIDMTTKYLFGDENEFGFVYLYLGGGMCFTIFCTSIVSIVLSLSSIISANFPIKILLITLLLYLFYSLWFKIYTSCLNFENRKKNEIFSVHNKLFFIALLLTFIIYNYTGLFNDLNLINQVNNSITVLTLLVLVLDRQGCMNNKRNDKGVENYESE